MSNDRPFRAFQIVVVPIVVPNGGGFLGVSCAGLVAVHKSIIAPLHQECVLSPFERVKTIQRISARDEERSPDIAVIGTTNRTQRINSKWSNAT